MTFFLASIIDRLRSDDFDLTTTMQRYNLVTEPFSLPDFGRSGTLVLAIGNTKALWPHITEIAHLNVIQYCGSVRGGRTRNARQPGD